LKRYSQDAFSVCDHSEHSPNHQRYERRLFHGRKSVLRCLFACRKMAAEPVNKY
jgi:hypothetical protein